MTLEENEEEEGEDTAELFTRLSAFVDRDLSGEAEASAREEPSLFQSLVTRAGGGPERGELIGYEDEDNSLATDRNSRAMYQRLSSAASRALSENATILRDVGDLSGSSNEDPLVQEVLQDLRRLLNSSGSTLEPDPLARILRPNSRAAQSDSRARPPNSSTPSRVAPPASRSGVRQNTTRRRTIGQADPIPVDIAPPRWAQPYYKVVAVVDGHAMSIFDGITEYAIGQTVMHPAGEDHSGGLYVSKTVDDCLRRDMEMFPAQSALLNAARGIVKVLAWNGPREAEPVRYGTKLAFTYVRAVQSLPYPSSWPRGGGERRVLHGNVRPEETRQVLANHNANLQVHYGAPPRRETLLRAQATTITLEQEVADMERRNARRLAGI